MSGLGMRVLISGLLLGVAPVALGEGYAELLHRYASEAGEPLDMERGRVLWETRVEERSCTNCHNSDITQPGQRKILFFSKTLKPMALSASGDRYRDAKNVDKALDKNCKRVFERTCSAREKGDILTYLTSM